MLGKVEIEKLFVENGSLLLEKLIASGSSRSIPIRSFSIEELLKATNNYDPHLLFHEDGSYQWYNGSFGGRLISVKKQREDSLLGIDSAFTDMAVCAKMCAHKNVLKLIGCCLETPSPVLVYESAENGTLSDRIYVSNPQHRPMPWTSKLKVAREIAHAIAYLHTAFSRPMIHRDIKPQNIFFDQRDIPKLSDFSLSIEIPEGEFEVEDVVLGTYGYACPKYVCTGIVTEKSDVYSFGSLLLELVTGKTFPVQFEYFETTSFTDLEHCTEINIVKTVESAIQAGEVEAGLEQQLQASLELARKCRYMNPESRPTMIDVTKELRRIERYAVTGVVTEKSDVYSFGSLLLVVLTGETLTDLYETTSGFTNLEDYIRTSIIKKIVESEIRAGEGEAGLEHQLQASLELALICRDENPEFRPTMIDVTKELRRIERSIP